MLNERQLIPTRRVSVEKLSILLIVEMCFSPASTWCPSIRVILPFITLSSVEASGFGLAFIAASSVGTSESGCRLRLRTSSPVRSSPFLASLVCGVCLPCCVCSFVLHVFCCCFRFSLFLLLLFRVCQVCWWTRGGILLFFLLCLVHVCLCLVAVLSSVSLALIRC